MKNFKSVVLFATTSLFFSSAHAYFCPIGFNQISIGDTIAQVEQQCGVAAEKKEEKTIEGPQEWNYYVRADPNAAPSVKMTIAFDHNKVINITVNAFSLQNTQVCNNVNIQVGDSTDTVQGACGKPIFINASTDAQQQSSTKVKLNYKTQEGITTYVFENGVLKQRL